MATIDLTSGVKGPKWENDRTFWMEKEIDFSEQNVTAGDIIQAIPQLAYTKAVKATIRKQTVAGATNTVDVGYTGGTADVLIDGANINALGVEDTKSTGETESASVHVTAADTIDILCNNTATAGKFTLMVQFDDARVPSDRAASIS